MLRELTVLSLHFDTVHSPFMHRDDVRRAGSTEPNETAFFCLECPRIIAPMKYAFVRQVVEDACLYIFFKYGVHPIILPRQHGAKLVIHRRIIEERDVCFFAEVSLLRQKVKCLQK